MYAKLTIIVAIVCLLFFPKTKGFNCYDCNPMDGQPSSSCVTVSEKTPVISCDGICSKISFQSDDSSFVFLIFPY